MHHRGPAASLSFLSLLPRSRCRSLPQCVRRGSGGGGGGGGGGGSKSAVIQALLSLLNDDVNL